MRATGAVPPAKVSSAASEVASAKAAMRPAAVLRQRHRRMQAHSDQQTGRTH